MKKLKIFSSLIILMNAPNVFSWEINCNVFDKIKNKSEGKLKFSKSYNLKESKKIKLEEVNYL